jgi:hypothetical protein
MLRKRCEKRGRRYDALTEMSCGMTRDEASRETADGGAGERGHSRPPPIARSQAVRLLRGRIHKRGNWSRCRTSLSRRSWSPCSVGRLEAAWNPSVLSSGDIQVPLNAGRVLSLPPRLADGFGLKGNPTRSRETHPTNGGSPVPTGFRHSVNGQSYQRRH